MAKPGHWTSSWSAEYAPAAQRARIQAGAVCHALRRPHPGMAGPGRRKGFRRTECVVDRLPPDLPRSEGEPVVGMLIAADDQRPDEREERLTQATSHRTCIRRRHGCVRQSTAFPRRGNWAGSHIQSRTSVSATAPVSPTMARSSRPWSPLLSACSQG